MVITSKPGDTVSLSLAAVNCPTAPLHSRSAGTWAVSGGFGRYAGATGGGTYFADIADTGGGRSSIHAEFVGILVRARHDDDDNDEGTGHQTWARVADMPTGREALGAAAGPDGRIYAIGGLGDSGPLDTVEAYTPGANTWATKASTLTRRFAHAAACSADGRIYAISGFNGEDILATVEAYTPSTDSWATVPSIPTPRAYLAAAAGADGRIFAIGGQNNGVEAAKVTVEVYTP
jgi:hypothetical protein